MCIGGVFGMRKPIDVSVCLRKFGPGSVQRRFTVDMHLQQLDIETMKMRNVRNEIHEVGELVAC